VLKFVEQVGLISAGKQDSECEASGLMGSKYQEDAGLDIVEEIGCFVASVQENGLGNPLAGLVPSIGEDRC